MLNNTSDDQWHPLSSSQKARWFLYQLSPSLRGLHNAAFSATVCGELTIERLSLAMNLVVAKHPILTASFRDQAGEPEQYFEKIGRAQTNLVDVSHLDSDSLKDLVRRDAAKPFDFHSPSLIRATIYRIEPEKSVLLVVSDHIAVDGWSFWRIFTELGERLSEGRSVVDLDTSGSTETYLDYVYWQREWLLSTKAEKQLQYWRDALVPESPRLRLGPPTRSLLEDDVGQYRVRLSCDATVRIQQFASDHGVTQFAILLAMFKMVLHRFSGEAQITVGTMMPARAGNKWADVVGDFANPIAITTNFPESSKVSDIIGTVHRSLRRGMARQLIPFSEVLLAIRAGARSAHATPFQAMFVLQDAREANALLPLLDPDDDTLVRWGGVNLAAFPVLQGGEVGPAGLLIDAVLLPEKILFDFRFLSSTHSLETIERLANAYLIGLADLLNVVEMSVAQVPLVSPEERTWLERAAQPSISVLTSSDTIHSRFESTCKSHPDAVALIWGATKLSYREVNDRADRLCNALRALGVRSQGKVAIYIQRSIATVIAQLATLKAGCSYIPLDPDSPTERLAFILTDSAPMAVIVDEFSGCSLDVNSIPLLAITPFGELSGTQPNSMSNPCQPMTQSASDLAYVIYTSGSTGRPKGVCIKHLNVLTLLESTRDLFRFGPGDVWSLFHSAAFDFSVWEIWGALLNGGSLVVIDKDVCRDPERFYSVLCAQGVTVLNQTPGAFRQLDEVQKVSELKHSVRIVIFGGEELKFGSLSGWVERNSLEKTMLVNMYGITEITIHATYAEIALADIQNPRGSVIGRPLPHLGVCITSPEGEVMPVGAVGEIMVFGYSLAEGYLNQEELTEERFTYGYVKGESFAGLRCYRSGDLGRWLPDGNLEYLGRNDAQVKVRGFRVELGEIEARLIECPGVKEATVLVVDQVPQGCRLVAYIVPEASNAQKLLPAALRASLLSSLPDYMLPSAFIFIPRLPLTVNGKIDVRALPNPIEGGESGRNFVPLSTLTEKRLAEIWSEALGVDRVGANDNFFALGGHSLIVLRILSRIRRAFEIEVPLRILFDYPDLASLAAYLDGMRREATIVHKDHIPTVSRREANVLSHAQQRMWFLNEYEDCKHLYNIPVALRLRGLLDVSVLEASFNEVVRRHESLRTVFRLEDGMPSQLIQDYTPNTIAIHDLRSISPNEGWRLANDLMAREAATPFDLQLGPTFRVSLICLSENEYALSVITHHIASDGWSMAVLLSEIGQIYRAFSLGSQSPLPSLSTQYVDYAAWSRDAFATDRLLHDLEYWQQQLVGSVASLDLPIDRPRGPLRIHTGATHRFDLTERFSSQVKDYCLATEVTQYMVLGAALAALLHQCSGQDDFCIGSPVAGREREELEGLIGLFVNTVVLRVRMERDMTFASLLQQFRETSVDAFAHRLLPFDKLVDAIGTLRNPAHSPLFQVMYVFQDAPSLLEPLPGLQSELLPIDSGTAKFDLTWSFWEANGRLHGEIEYRTDLFDATTIEAMALSYKGILESALSADLPSSRLGRLKGNYLDQRLSYWERALAGAPELLDLPTDRPRPAMQTQKGAVHKFELGSHQLSDVTSFAQQHGATLFAVLGAVFNALLHRYSRQDDICVGTMARGRTQEEIDGGIGFFKNTLVLRSRIDRSTTFFELLDTFKSTVLEAFAHGDLPFEQLIAHIKPKRSQSYSPLFQVMFVLQTNMPDGVKLHGSEFDACVSSQNGTAKFDITLTLSEGADGLSGVIEYNTSLFDEATIARFARLYVTLLNSACTKPDARIVELPILPKDDERQILSYWNQTATSFPHGASIHQLFEAQVARTPYSVALIYEEQCLTYEQVNAEANQVAHRLRELDVLPGDIVGICVERSFEMVTGLLGILKAGASYVPLDPRYPKDRLSYMLDDARPSVLLTQKRVLASLPYFENVLCLDDRREFELCDPGNSHISTQPDDVVYFIYTSGSTGRPKGAGVRQQGVVNLAMWYGRTMDFSEKSRTLLISAYGFDLTQKNLFTTLLFGGRLYLPREGYDPEYLAGCVDHWQITTINSTPSMFCPIVHGRGRNSLISLKHIVLGGEPIKTEDLLEWLSQIPVPGPTIHNTYGPTECTDVVAHEPWRLGDSVPICLGYPIDNTEIYILDNLLNPVPIGVEGELCISGICVGTGYLNRADLTKEKFVNKSVLGESKKLYRTGDRARFDADGKIHYFGRIDHQVKLRGFRIELDEIARQLEQIQGVKESVVVLREDVPGHQVLVAYLVAKIEADGLRSALDQLSLKTALRTRLPDYMVPTHFVTLDVIPLTSNGKIDRNSLPIPRLGGELSASYVEPKTEVQRKLAGIWCSILHIERVGLGDNFFEVGGNSLAVVSLYQTLRDKMDSNLSVAQLFAFRTLEDMAEAVEVEPSAVPLTDERGSERGALRNVKLRQRAERARR